ncbi:hypothetical protein TSOC_007484 [Tetrabaena socialis]|uniref:Uncharacterized protein n=1 Tax=Tetrabaena socialis TaxID=47790 RepID=A0A2J8A0Y1_9CHLO|nr:hypothetical protein TSOC_007484 [Tetrabaena socialis]|eukprot:PNH06177.1 hypothetical protein TSOC_007484 [Tetrabaena socialis]
MLALTLLGLLAAGPALGQNIDYQTGPTLQSGWLAGAARWRRSARRAARARWRTCMKKRTPWTEQVRFLGKSANFQIFPNIKYADNYIQLRFSKFEERDARNRRVDKHAVPWLLLTVLQLETAEQQQQQHQAAEAARQHSASGPRWGPGPQQPRARSRLSETGTGSTSGAATGAGGGGGRGARRHSLLSETGGGGVGGGGSGPTATVIGGRRPRRQSLLAAPAAGSVWARLGASHGADAEERSTPLPSVFAAPFSADQVRSSHSAPHMGLQQQQQQQLRWEAAEGRTPPRSPSTAFYTPVRSGATVVPYDGPDGNPESHDGGAPSGGVIAFDRTSAIRAAW